MEPTVIDEVEEYWVIKKNGKYLRFWQDFGYPHSSGYCWVDNIESAKTIHDLRGNKKPKDFMPRNSWGGSYPSREQEMVKHAALTKIRRVKHITYEETGDYKT